jgi:ArsR family transcriptional regulator
MPAQTKSSGKTKQAPGTAPSVPPCCTPVLASALSEADAGELARTLGALADPVRLRLLSLIAAAGECCSCDLEEPLGRSQPTVSHHTKALAEAGLITGEKRGRWMWWRVVPERLDAVAGALSGRAAG